MGLEAIRVNPSPRVNGKPSVVTSGFGPRSDGFHAGVDLLVKRTTERPGYPVSSPNGRYAMPSGQPAFAAGDGRVTRAEWAPDTTGGWFVEIDHGDGWKTWYLHMRKRGFFPTVVPGQKVRAGEEIGTISYDTRQGNQGINHMHWEVRHHGSPVDPEQLFGRDLAALEQLDGSSGFLVKAGITVGLAWLAYRYVFT